MDCSVVSMEGTDRNREVG